MKLMRAPSRKALKEEYLACLHARSPVTLRQTIQGLVRLGVQRHLLLVWAVAAGHEKKRVAQLLSQCFCALGLRERRPGAGRPTPAHALLILAFAHELFGDQQRRCLRSASRAANGPPAAQLVAEGMNLIQVPELYAAAVARFAKKFSEIGTTQTKNRRKRR